MTDNSPRRILVTNDDSVSSIGLWHLAAALRAKGHDVVVVAPSAEASGSAAAVGDIGPGAKITFAPAPWPEPWSGSGVDTEVPAFQLDGPPARCTLAALIGVFGPAPDLVVSGINAGANTGRFLQLHSGTLGGALTAANSGLRGMAISLDTITLEGPIPADEARWATAADVAAELIDRLAAQPVGTTWNVNVPNVDRADLKGLAEAVPANTPLRLVAEEVDEGCYEMSFVQRPERAAPPGGPPADRAVMADGWAAITAVAPTTHVALGSVDLTIPVGPLTT